MDRVFSARCDVCRYDEPDCIDATDLLDPDVPKVICGTCFRNQGFGRYVRAKLDPRAKIKGVK